VPTYQYEDQMGDVHEEQQRITDPPHTHRNPETGEWFTMSSSSQEVSAQVPASWRVKRLISGASTFCLKEGAAGGWSGSNYGHTPAQLNAMRKLGKLTRRV
jgi:hypothetical protein